MLHGKANFPMITLQFLSIINIAFKYILPFANQSNTSL